ncbi:hypothetical protein Tco_1099036 [Tanacetum coccineum]
MHLKRQIEELIKNGKLSHVIKELKQGSEKDQPKTTKKGETSRKDKHLAILMAQPWQRVARCLAWILLLDYVKSIFPVPVMAISVISISSDSSEDSVGTPDGRVILFGHPVDHSSSDYFSPDDSARDSSSDSSSKASSDFHSDASSDSSSRHSLSDHSSPDLPSTSAGPSHKRRRSPTTSVPALLPVSGALSPVRADLIPSPKRVKDYGYLADVEVDPREISLRDDAIVRVSDKPYLEQDIDPEIQAEIDECIAY